MKRIKGCRGIISNYTITELSCLETCLVSRQSQDTIFQSLGLEDLKSRSRLGTLKSRKMSMSRRDIWVGRIFYFSYGTISTSKYAENNSVSRLPNNVQSVILWRSMVVKS